LKVETIRETSQGKPFLKNVNYKEILDDKLMSVQKYVLGKYVFIIFELAIFSYIFNNHGNSIILNGKNMLIFMR